MDKTLVYSGETEDNNERARIKYLYSIDMDTFIADIINSDFYKQFSKDPLDPQKGETMMYELYDEIFSVCDLYTAYLDPNMPSVSHFGHYLAGTNCSEVICTYRHFLNLCLRNHCIMKDFSMRLPKNECRKLVRGQEFKNRVGYFDVPPTPSDYSPNSSQFYNYHKNRLKSEEELYSVKMLQNMVPSDDFASGPNCRAPYISFGDYLYTNNEVNYLDKELLKDGSESVWEKYSYLVQNYNYRTAGYITSIANYALSFSGITYHDAFQQKGSNLILFTAPMEFTYGFSSFRYIVKILKQIENSTIPENNALCLKDLDGSIIFTIFSMMLKCPLIYTRHFFMDYALYCIFNSQDLESTYLTQSSASAVYRFPGYNNSSKASKLSKILNLTRQFFDTLNNITIPLLEDMWHVCITELIEPLIRQSSDMVSFYKKYIDDNSLLLTGDFSAFSIDELDNFILKATNDTATYHSATNNKVIIISHNIDLVGLKDALYSSQQEKQLNIKNEMAIKEHAFEAKQKQKNDLSAENNFDGKNYNNFPNYMDVPDHYLKNANRLLNDFLSIDAYRFRKNANLHGYVNHIYSNMNLNNYTSSYEYAFRDYSRESLLRSIELYGENSND